MISWFLKMFHLLLGEKEHNTCVRPPKFIRVLLGLSFDPLPPGLLGTIGGLIHHYSSSSPFTKHLLQTQK